MKRLIMCQGLPGSGKSTWTNLQKCNDPNHVYRVNKDEIRRGLEADGWQWSRENEADVIKRRDEMICFAFNVGYEVVISDDTNFGRKHKVRLEQLARENDAVFEIRKFDTPIDECIRRDSLREGKAKVGEAVIRRMANQYGLDKAEPLPSFAPYVVPKNTRKAIVCDLDGTLCLFQGQRSPYDASTCADDTLNKPVARLLEVYYRFMNYQIIYLSGRKEQFREPTNTFLRKHHAPPGPLHMRADGDNRTDWIIKGELFNTHVRDKYDVEFVLDDRDQVVKFWRSIGLTVFQVAEGNF